MITNKSRRRINAQMDGAYKGVKVAQLWVQLTCAECEYTMVVRLEDVEQARCTLCNCHFATNLGSFALPGTNVAG